MLERCIRSLAGVVDVLVPLDGRWQAFADDLPAASPLEQRELVLDVAADLDGDFLTVHVPTPTRPFESQVAKRSHLYGIAAGLARWVLVIDADEHVEQVAHGFHDRLAELEDDLVALVACRAVNGQTRNAGVHSIPRLFSSAEGLTVDRVHNGVRTTTGRWLAGDGAHVKPEEPADLSADLVLFHAQGAGRPHERELADRAYRYTRARRHLERWHT